MVDSQFALRRQLVALLGAGLFTFVLCSGSAYMFAGWYLGLLVGATIAVLAIGGGVTLLVAAPMLRRVRARTDDSKPLADAPTKRLDRIQDQR